jgi:hypothetical protein
MANDPQEELAKFGLTKLNYESSLLFLKKNHFSIFLAILI